MINILILCGMALFCVIFISYEYFERKTGVPTFPTMPHVRRKIIALLQADVTQKNFGRPYRILDLGSGSGQMTHAIAKAIPNAHVTGLDLSFIPILRSNIRKNLQGVKNLDYKRIDFWPYDTSDYDAVITYLPGKIMEQVGQKLHRELKPNTLVMANIFPIRDGWEPQDTIVFQPFNTKLFVYRN